RRNFIGGKNPIILVLLRRLIRPSQSQSAQCATVARRMQRIDTRQFVLNGQGGTHIWRRKKSQRCNKQTPKLPRLSAKCRFSCVSLLKDLNLADGILGAKFAFQRLHLSRRRLESFERQQLAS